ncbi:MAG: hypothetical protein AAGJ82_13350 [Bacteroidota bacterium]
MGKPSTGGWSFVWLGGDLLGVNHFGLPTISLWAEVENGWHVAFRQLGVEKGLAYAWSRSRMSGWAIAQSPIMGTTLTIEHLAKRGYTTFTQYYEKVTYDARIA